MPRSTPVFKTGVIDHSTISPKHTLPCGKALDKELNVRHQAGKRPECGAKVALFCILCKFSEDFFLLIGEMCSSAIARIHYIYIYARANTGERR